MEMTWLEKWFVNRSQKAKGNITRVRQRLAELPTEAIEDVLEIGCGTGAVAAYLAETYKMNVRGTDYDSAQIQIAHKRHPENEQLTYRVEDAAHLSFQDASFDLVVSQNVFHHLPDWPAAVKEVARVLRPQGFLIWLDLAFPRLIQKLFQPLVKNHGLYCISDITLVFINNGFEQIFYEKRLHGPFFQHQIVCKMK